MQLKRLFTTAGKDPLSSIKFAKRRSEIKNPDGSLSSGWMMYLFLKAGHKLQQILLLKSILEKPVFQNF